MYVSMHVCITMDVYNAGLHLSGILSTIEGA